MVYQTNRRRIVTPQDQAAASEGHADSRLRGLQPRRRRLYEEQVPATTSTNTVLKHIASRYTN